MPAGTVCGCGELTNRPSRKCERCEGEASANKTKRIAVYADPRWTATRLLVWNRDRWTCQQCGHKDVGNLSKSLDAHHTTSVLELLARGISPFDSHHAVTRCKKCHGGTR
jgi:hypothetical protein